MSKRDITPKKLNDFLEQLKTDVSKTASIKSLSVEDIDKIILKNKKNHKNGKNNK